MSTLMRYQPQGLARINQKNPLAAGLALARTGAQVDSKGAGTSGFYMVRSASGGYTDPAFPVTVSNSSTDLFSGSQEFTFAALVRRLNVNAGVNQQALRFRASGNSNNTVASLGFTSSSSVGNAQFSALGVSASFNIGAASSTNPDTVMLVGVYDKATNLMSLYVNGKLVNSVDISATTGITHASGNQLFMADASGGSINQGVLPYVAYVWPQRALQAAEVQALSDNPWQLFDAGSSSSSYQSYTDASGGGATNTGTLAWTEANDSIDIGATFSNLASVSWIESGDTYVVSTSFIDRATVSYTDGDDAYTVSINISGGGANTLEWTETDDTYGTIGVVYDAVSISWSEANDIHTNSALLTNRSFPAWTEDNDTSNLTGVNKDFGTLLWTEADDGVLFLPSEGGTGSIRRRKSIHK